MHPFTTLQSTLVPLPIDHVDTDQIIPARFLKATSREGFGENLFRDWRYDKEGNPKPDFVLNQSLYSGEILLVGENFGSGSSREHAAWAIQDYGFKVVLSSSFADIFKNNALNNGLLVAELSPSFVATLFEEVKANPQTLITVDLENQEVLLHSQKTSCQFEIEPFKKTCLLEGLDNIDYLLKHSAQIKHFEQVRTHAY